MFGKKKNNWIKKFLEELDDPQSQKKINDDIQKKNPKVPLIDFKNKKNIKYTDKSSPILERWFSNRQLGKSSKNAPLEISPESAACFFQLGWGGGEIRKRPNGTIYECTINGGVFMTSICSRWK